MTTNFEELIQEAQELQDKLMLLATEMQEDDTYDSDDQDEIEFCVVHSQTIKDLIIYLKQ